MQNTMPVQPMPMPLPFDEPKNLAIGISIGLLAASIGALYTVYARWGIAHGLSSPDLTALRFAVAGIAMLPWLLHAIIKRREALFGKWRIWLAVSLLAGTPFVPICGDERDGDVDRCLGAQRPSLQAQSSWHCRGLGGPGHRLRH